MVDINKVIVRSRVTEVDATSIRLIAAGKQRDWSSDTHLTGVLTRLDGSSSRLTTAVSRDKTASNLEEKNDVREYIIKSLYYVLRGLAHHPDKTIRDNAKPVLTVFQKYGVAITRKSYADQTSLIGSMSEDFDAPAVQTLIPQLSGCAELIAELRAAQTDFEQTRVGYEQAKAQDENTESASEVKKEVLKIINDDLVPYLSVMSRVDEAKYGDFARTVATIIDDNNMVVKRRAKKEGTEPNNVELPPAEEEETAL